MPQPDTISVTFTTAEAVDLAYNQHAEGVRAAWFEQEFVPRLVRALPTTPSVVRCHCEYYQWEINDDATYEFSIVGAHPRIHHTPAGCFYFDRTNKYHDYQCPTSCPQPGRLLPRW